VFHFELTLRAQGAQGIQRANRKQVNKTLSEVYLNFSVSSFPLREYFLAFQGDRNHAESEADAGNTEGKWETGK
jgi:hypothetical protein